MAILITGGTGYLGSYLARKLVHKENERLVLFDFFPNTALVENIDRYVEIVQGDVAEPVELMAVFRKYDISHIFHLAYSFGAECENHPLRAMRLNVQGTHNLFEMALLAGVKRVIWASSAAVYGSIRTSEKAQLVSETDKLMPSSFYGACKVFNENFAEVYAQRRGFDHIAVRISPTYGFGRAQRRGHGYIPDVFTYLVEQPARGEAVVAPPVGHLLAWSYIEDLALAFYCAYKAVKPKSRIFNFSGEVRPVRDTVSYLKTLFPDVSITMGSDGLITTPCLRTDLIRKELGFEPQYSMERGIKDYADCLLSRAARR